MATKAKAAPKAPAKKESAKEKPVVPKGSPAEKIGNPGHRGTIFHWSSPGFDNALEWQVVVKGGVTYVRGFLNDRRECEIQLTDKGFDALCAALAEPAEV